MTTTSLDPRQFERLLDVGSALVSQHDPEVVLGEVRRPKKAGSSIARTSAG